MNRSVINWMIAAGVLSAGAVVTAVPAVADPVGLGPSSGSDTVKPSGSDTVKRDDDRGADRRPVRHNERSAAEKPDSGRDDGWPCCSRICRPAEDDATGDAGPVVAQTDTGSSDRTAGGAC